MSINNYLDLSRTICSLYRQLQRQKCLDWNNRDNAILFSIQMRATNQNSACRRYGEAPEMEVRRSLHFVLNGYPRVYVCEAEGGENVSMGPQEQGLWKNVSNHDSCWSSDGIGNSITQLYFAMCTYVSSVYPEDSRPAPVEIAFEATLGDWLGWNPIQFVKITRGPFVDSNRYHDTLSHLEKLEFELTLKERNKEIIA